jgi:hypothetical protein
MLTREQIKDCVEYMFKLNENISLQDRYIKGRRHCKTDGTKDILDLIHCGDNECVGCNMYVNEK